MTRLLLLGWTLLIVCGCALTPREIATNIIMPEQRSIPYPNPDRLPPAPIPDHLPPHTVSNPQLDEPEWPLSLDDAIRIALENARVIRVLGGVTAVSSGRTIYDPAIANTIIDQEQARFDPVLKQNNLWNRINTPFGVPDPDDPLRSGITSTPTSAYRSDFGVTKTNVFGGQSALNWSENPTRIGADRWPLNPQNRRAVELSYTQPLLQGAGFQVNTAPIVIARLNTEQSFFQYKNSVQEMVRGVIEGYWTLVQARTEVLALNFQVDLAEFTYKREQARLDAGLGDKRDVSQALVSFKRFQANQIAAQAAVLTREAALRNLLGLAPNDGRRIVPVSMPASRRLQPDWNALLRLAEQRRPDIVELKLITEADRVRLLQSENQALPRVDLTTLYRWNGLNGTMPNGENLGTEPGQFTDWSVGVNFSVPLGLRRERAQVRQQKLLIDRDLANLEQGLHAAVHEVANTLRDLESAFEQYQVNREASTAAYENLAIQSKHVEAGRFNYLNFLQALNDWGNAVTSEARQLLTYNVGLATLERQTGTILETHGLVFAEERFRAAGPLPLPCGDREYPSSLPPIGSPERYPATEKPSENIFNLKNPFPRDAKPPEQP